MSAPAFLVIILVTLVPIVLATAMSFTNVEVSPGGLNFTWDGLANYRAILASGPLRGALVFTTGFTVASVVIGLVIGTAIALVLDEMSSGRSFVLLCLLLPFSVMAVIGGEVWAYILNGIYGVANYILVSLHIVSEPVTFLNSPQGAFWAIVMVNLWKFVPFVVLIVLGGLRMIDREIYDAACLDGAGFLNRVFRITIPLVRPALVTAAVFRILQCFAVFDTVYVLTKGGPGRSTESIAMLMYETLFQSFDLSRGVAISTIATFIVLLIAVAVIRLSRLQLSATE